MQSWFGPREMRMHLRAANAGVPDRAFKRHGRWKSENAKDGYVKDTLEYTLSVTKSLGF